MGAKLRTGWREVRRGSTLLALAVVLCTATPHDIDAQVSPPHDNAITANPFLLLFEWFNAEWEHRIGPDKTIGVSVAHFSLDDGGDVYNSLSGLFRVFPQERAPSGFFLGGRLGFHRVDVETQDESALGIGIEVGYTWLLGSEQTWVVSLGAGVTRLFSDAGEGVLPGIRLVNVGWAF